MTYGQVSLVMALLTAAGLLLVGIAVQRRDEPDKACETSDVLVQPRHHAAAEPFIDEIHIETLNLIESATCRPLPYPRDLRGLHIESIAGQRGSRDNPVDPNTDSLGDFAAIVFFDADEQQTIRLRLEVSPFPLDERSFFTPPQEEPRLSSVFVQGKTATVTQALAPAGSINIVWEKDGYHFRAFCNFGEGEDWFRLDDALAIIESIR